MRLVLPQPAGTERTDVIGAFRHKLHTFPIMLTLEIRINDELWRLAFLYSVIKTDTRSLVRFSKFSPVTEVTETLLYYPVGKLLAYTSSPVMWLIADI
jgi:hypothetical protein